MSLRPPSLLLQLCFEGLPEGYLNLGVGENNVPQGRGHWRKSSGFPHMKPVCRRNPPHTCSPRSDKMVRWMVRQIVRKPSPMPRWL